MQCSDDELAQKWKAGDITAFEAIYHRYERRVLNVAARMMCSLDDAEDVKQETFIRAHRSIGGFRGGKFSTWLYKIAANLCLDMARRKSNQATSLDDLVEGTDWHGPCDEGANPEMALLKDEFSCSVRTVLASIPPHYRILLVLRHMDDMSYEEIAGILGCSVNALGVRLHRAREMFKERMKPSLDQDGGSTRDEVQKRKTTGIPAI